MTNESLPQFQNALLVDDEAYFRRFVGQLLKNFGIPKVTEACDGAQAIDLFQTLQPDLVVLDINMPRLDGLETLKALLQLNPDLPIIMLTSISDESVVEQCVECGASYFIRKDVPANEITAELSKAFAQFSS